MAALADGVVTHDERADLPQVTALLGLDEGHLDQAEAGAVGERQIGIPVVDAGTFLGRAGRCGPTGATELIGSATI